MPGKGGSGGLDSIFACAHDTAGSHRAGRGGAFGSILSVPSRSGRSYEGTAAHWLRRDPSTRHRRPIGISRLVGKFYSFYRPSPGGSVNRLI